MYHHLFKIRYHTTSESKFFFLLFHTDQLCYLGSKLGLKCIAYRELLVGPVEMPHLLMFNVSSKLCMCACKLKPWDEHTRENLEHTQMFFPEMFLHIFHTCHSKYRWVMVNCCTQKKCYVHADFEGTLLMLVCVSSPGHGIRAENSSHPCTWQISFAVLQRFWGSEKYCKGMLAVAG